MLYNCYSSETYKINKIIDIKEQVTSRSLAENHILQNTIMFILQLTVTAYCHPFRVKCRWHLRCTNLSIL